MIVQITNYGASLLKETNKPFCLDKYSMGSSFGYTPSLSADGILGNEEYSGNPSEYQVVNGNVVKYRIGLDFDVKTFSFGEIALYVENRCVAVCVSSELIEKQKYESKTFGNSIVIDVYLSMVDNNFTMWTDDLTSSNKFSIPVVSSIDYLYPVSYTTSNLYAIKAPSQRQSAILAYSTKDGLWNFDVYQLKNTATLKVTDSTSTNISCDISEFSLEDLNDIIPRYFGDLILQFSGGNLNSICRNVKSTVISGNKAIISFNTPLAMLPKNGDIFILYGKQVLSVADTIFPIATKDSLGAIIPGNGLTITPQGVVDVEFPVTSVNGHLGDVVLEYEDFPWMAKVAQTGKYEDLITKYNLPIANNTTLGGVKTTDTSHVVVGPTGVVDLRNPPINSINGKTPDPATGNIEIDYIQEVKGLINPQEITSGNLNDVTTDGLYFVSANNSLSLGNTPIPGNATAFTLEVIPFYNDKLAGSVIQRATTATTSYIRYFNDITWSTWVSAVTSANLPIASSTVLGAIRIGDGVSIDSSNARLSANVLSVFGKTGDVTLSFEELNEMLRPFFNVEGGIPQLSSNPDTSLTPEEREEQEFKYARVSIRQLPIGAMYVYGTWNADTNVINEDTNYTLASNGKISVIEENHYTNDAGEPVVEYETVLYDATGYVLKVTESGETAVDGTSKWYTGDIILSINNNWVKLKDQKMYDNIDNKVNKPKAQNKFIPSIVYVDENGETVPLTEIYGGKF